MIDLQFREWLDDLRVAVALLTRVPMPHPDGATPPNLARAQRLFPLVGVAIGAAIGALYSLFDAASLPPLASAALAIGAGALLTGALHEDGLGDVGDGFGGGRDCAAKLEIMRDSRLGTYGALTVVAAFVIKAAAIADLAPAYAFGALIAAHTLGRAAIPVLAATLPFAREDGLGKGSGRPDLADVGVAVATGSVVAMLCMPLSIALLSIVLAGAGAAAVAWLARWQIGGVTGDVFGAAEQVVEIAVLLLAAARFG